MHEHKKEIADPKDEIDTWKIEHEDPLNEASMTNILREINNYIWGYVSDDVPSIRK